MPGGWSGSGRLEIGEIRYLETRRMRMPRTTPARIRTVMRRVSGRFEYIIQRLRPRSACTLLKQLRGAFRLLSLSHAVSEATPPSVAGRKYICIYIIKRLRFGGVPSVPPSVPAPPAACRLPLPSATPRSNPPARPPVHVLTANVPVTSAPLPPGA